ncbi:nuclear transport factor 2 family protein [Croceiramulus getboli]|nr:nuclear transport factor 2 family protein [Flavobacteriaceae bacterium YJPT1-3]
MYSFLKYLRPLGVIALILLLIGCTTSHSPEPEIDPDPSSEKKAILAALNQETQAAFTRDYEAWKSYWIQEPYVTKYYLHLPDSSFTQTEGWTAIDDFVQSYMTDHPEPDPLPAPLTEADIRLYGTGAWVTYEQIDPARGRKKETRLMEKDNGQWKIAGMKTIIYGGH